MAGSLYIGLIRLSPRARRPLAATLVGRIPDGIAALSILILLRSSTGSYSTAGAAAAGFGLGTAVCAPLAGRALDRLGQGRVLSALAAGFAVSLTAFGLVAGRLGAGWMIGLATLAGMTRPPLEAGLRAWWPRAVPGDRLETAYALDA